MKKNKMKLISGSVLILATVFLVGCGGGAKNDTTSKVSSNNKKITAEKKGLAEGLKEAMKKGVTMKCQGGDSNGSFVTYTNGKNFRTETMSGNVKHIVVMKNGVSYIWEEGAKTGQKMDKKCIEGLQKEMGIDAQAMMETNDMDDLTPEDLEAKEAAGKVNCVPSSKANFSVPNDVEFVDQCEFMKQQMSGAKEQMKKIQNAPEMKKIQQQIPEVKEQMQKMQKMQKMK